MHFKILTSAATILFLAVCTSLDAEVSPQDSMKMQGDWIVVKYEEGGLNLPLKGKMHWTFNFNRDKISSVYTDGEIMIGSFELDDLKKPKEINIVWKENRESIQVKGIYVFKENKLYICVGSKPGDRPRDFLSTIDTGNCLMILDRDVKRGRSAP